MKKRLLALALSICMLTVMIPAAFAAEQLPATTGLEWVEEAGTIQHQTTDGTTSNTHVFPWDIKWDRVANGTNSYDIYLYKDNTEIDSTTWSFDATDISPAFAVDFFRMEPRESGTYYFTIQALGDGQDLADGPVATSAKKTYTAPDAQLAYPTNLRWDGTTARWDAVEGAGGYTIEWYYSPTATGELRPVGSTGFGLETEIELEDWILTEAGPGYYAFAIRTMSDDVDTIRPSELSQLSARYSTDGATADVSDALDNILNSVGENATEDEIKAAVNAVKSLDSEELRVAMAADTSDDGVNSKIQELENKTNIDVNTTVQDGLNLDAGKISLTGAALNAAEGTDKVNFQISKPEEDMVVKGAYTNAVQFDFQMDGTESTEEFAVPIKITMPLPQGIDPTKVRILHYTASGALEEIVFPHVFENDGIYYASFVVTHFSTFVFANVTTAATIGDVYYDSLQEAIDAAESGDTVSLYSNHDDTEVRVAGKSLDINCGVYTLNPDVIILGANCTKTVTGTNGEDQVIHITYSSSSGGGSSSGGSSGSSSSSAPSASVSGTGGRVSASSNGTVTITPDEGYQIASITVNGETVEIPSDGKLTGLDPDDKVVVTFEQIPTEGESGVFADVASNAWYADAVQYVYENGMMNGTSTTQFSPNATTTRAMIVTILHRLEGEPAADASSFTDVAAGSYYADAVNWAAANGIVTGISETSFAPDDPITREQMAAILYRYAQYKGYDVTASADLSAYTDAAQISSYAAAAMQWVNAEGLITGNTATTINPAGNATRAEVATILMRFVENSAK